MSLAKAAPNLQVKIVKTKYEKHAIEIAKKEADIADVLVAVGGDGTCNEVLQGIRMSGNHDVCLAIIPNGTGNDFFKMLTPLSEKAFIDKLVERQPKRIDIGMTSFQSKTAPFLNIADLGFGAKVVEIMNKQRRLGIGGKLSYAMAILRSFFIYKKSQILIKGDDFEYNGKVLMVAFCNGSTFGHGIVINPDATLDNGNLCLTVIGDVSLITYIRKLSKLKQGIKITHPKIHYFKSTNTRIIESDMTQVVEGDGELLGKSVAEIYVLKSALNIIC